MPAHCLKPAAAAGLPRFAAARRFAPGNAAARTVAVRRVPIIAYHLKPAAAAGYPMSAGVRPIARASAEDPTGVRGPVPTIVRLLKPAAAAGRPMSAARDDLTGPFMPGPPCAGRARNCCIPGLWRIS